MTEELLPCTCGNENLDMTYDGRKYYIHCGKCKKLIGGENNTNLCAYWNHVSFTNRRFNNESETD